MSIVDVFDPALEDETSRVYILFTIRISTAISNVLRLTIVGFLYVDNFRYSEGSIVCDFRTVVNSTSNATATVIKDTLISANGTERVNNFTFGSVAVAQRVTQIEKDTDNLYIIIGVCVGAAFIILLLLLVILVSVRK